MNACTPKIDLGDQLGGFKTPTLSLVVSGTKAKPVKQNVFEELTHELASEKQKSIEEDEMGTKNSANKPSSEQTLTDDPNVPKYLEPSWSGMPPEGYSFEIIKNGIVVDNFELCSKPFFVFGRADTNVDLHLDHPTISRFHTAIQYRAKQTDGSERGFYLYDLGSTHGTILNKEKVQPRVYYRLRVGHVVKFAGSTRLFVLQGPEGDMEEESALSVTQLRARMMKQKEILEGKLRKSAADEVAPVAAAEDIADKKKADTAPEKDVGINWGMAEDAVEEPEEHSDDSDDDQQNFGESLDFLKEMQEREQYYVNDPKKALRHYFERQGLEMTFIYAEKGTTFNHQWSCKIELPIDGPDGGPIVVESSVSGSKRDAMTHCCLEACRGLDANNALRQSSDAAQRRKQKNWEDNDYFDSDEDEFLDRTGELAAKRQKRMQRLGKVEQKPQTYDVLVSRLSQLADEIRETEREIEIVAHEISAAGSIKKLLANATTEDVDVAPGPDSLECFMTTLRSGSDAPMTEAASIDAKAKLKRLKEHLASLQKESERTGKLIKIAKPVALPELQTLSNRKLPIVGSMKGGVKFKRLTPAQIQTQIKPPPRLVLRPATCSEGDVVENDEEEDEAEEAQSGKGGPVKPASDCIAESIYPKEPTDSQDASRNVCSSNGPSTSKECDISRPPLNEAPEMEGESRTTSMSEANVTKQSSKISDKIHFANAAESQSKLLRSDVEQLKSFSIRPKQTKKGDWAKGYDSTDPKFAVWLPPEDQAGDGKIKLNEKLGY